MKKPANEAARLARLGTYGILDTDFERQYHELAALAAALCGTPQAVISLVDEDRVWFKATHGIPVSEVPRESAFCAFTILGNEANVQSDLLAVPEYASLKIVAGAPHLRSYLGVPLLSPDGFALGAVAVLDFKPREFTPAQIAGVATIARQVMSQLELGRTNRALARSQENLRQERERFKHIVEDLHEVVFRTDLAGRWTYLNPAWQNHLGHSVTSSLGSSILTHVNAEERAPLADLLKDLAEGRVASIRPHVRFASASGAEKVFELFAKRSVGLDGLPFLAGTLTDLTLLLATHNKALEHEQEIRSFYASSPFYMGLAEMRGEEILFLSVNPATRRLMKVGADVRFPALSSRTGMTPEVIRFWREKYDECSRAGGMLTFEATFGDETDLRWLRVYMSQVNFGEDGVPRYSFVTADVTEEKQRQNLLESQRLLLETVSEHAGDVIWMADMKSGEIIFVSKAYEKLWGRSRESLLASRNTFLEPIHPEDRARVLAALPFQPTGCYEEIYRVQSPAGESWVRDRAFPVKNAAGEVVQLVGIASDITAARHQEENVRRVKENLEVVLSHLPLAVCVYDNEGRREYVNNAWTMLMGYTAAEVVGRPVARDLFPSEEVANAALALLNGTGEGNELTFRTKAGDLKACRVSIIPLPQGRKMTVTRDLTPERAQEKLIEEQRQAMIESARLSSLGEMAASIGHEINNPLAIIQGSAELMLTAIERGGSLDEEKLKRSMERISTTVSRIAKIIVGLKSFARDGRKDPLAPASLKSVIGEALELCQTRFRNNGVELHLDLPEKDVLVAARPVQLAQLLVNLLNNSFDAISQQNAKRVEIALRLEGERVALRVLDNGPGVPEELREKIMQPFFTTKAPGKGTGLGLSLSRSIVEDHGGRLVVKTVNGMTCFEADLPALPRAA